MPHATVKGEIHVSRKDKGSVIDQIKDVDAVMREKVTFDPDDRSMRDTLLSPTYTLLILGFWLYKSTIGKLYFSRKDIETEATELGKGYHHISASLSEWDNMTGDLKKWGVYGFAFGLTISYFMQYSFFLAAALFALLFPLYYLLFLALMTVDERNTYMAERTMEIAGQEGYERVLISTGDAHKKGIASVLEENGWDVDVQGSTSPVAVLLRPIIKLLE